MRVRLNGGDRGERSVIGRALAAAGCALAGPDEACDLVLTLGARAAEPAGSIRRHGLILDPASGVATLAGRTARLSRLEAALLARLMRSERGLARDELIAAVWGYRCDPGTNIVAVHVSRIRTKLGRDAILLVGGRYRIADPDGALAC